MMLLSQNVSRNPHFVQKRNLLPLAAAGSKTKRKYFINKGKNRAAKGGIIPLIIELFKEIIFKNTAWRCMSVLKFLTYTKNLSDIFIFAKMR